MVGHRLSSEVYGFLVAAPWSGSGKTIITCALLRALRKKGLEVAPFKVGPDYIDPLFLEKAAGRPCYNLDLFFTPGEALLRSFSRGFKSAEVAVVEGVMGLFDGLSGGKQASSAEVARRLGLPVVLILPASHLAGTAAAIVKGLRDFDPELRFAGIILNQVGSPRHAKILQEALRETSLPLLGIIPREETLRWPSRHLGLVQAMELDLEEKLESWATLVEKWVDLELLLQEARKKSTLRLSSLPSRPSSFQRRVAVALDEAFAFYYRENLDLLVEAGAELLYFSPLRDPFPEKAEALYLGGGYPELFAERLASRKDLLSTLRKKFHEGLPVLAECGGFMFLLEAIKTPEGVFPMVGVIRGIACLETKLQALGYREVRIKVPDSLFPPEHLARGHEFRYSRVLHSEQRGLEVRDAQGEIQQTWGIARENFLASYVHFHFGGPTGIPWGLLR